MRSLMNVLIAGGGPTGLTLAIELARRDIAVRVIDQADEYFQGSRGDGLQPRTLEVFEDLGILDQVLAQGIPVPLLKVSLGGKPAGERRMGELVEPTPDRPYPNGYLLGQSRTEAILRDRLAALGTSVELSTALVSFHQEDDRVVAQLSTGERVEADFLVGADGGKSVVRKQLGIAFEGTTDDSFRMLLGDVSADGLDHDYGYWFAAADNPMDGIVMTPLSGGDQFQFGAPLGDLGLEPTLETLQGLVDRYAGEGVAKLRDLTWSTVWRPNIRLAKHFRAGRVFIAGDAAHVHPPTGGQGLNTGVQDAYNLGWKLADGREEVLATYEPERRTNAARVLGLSEGLLQKHLDGDETALDRGEDVRQLDISYRSPDATGPLTSGDRAPDSPLIDANGNNLRLFDLYRGPHETLLRFAPSTPTDHPYAVAITRETLPGSYTSPEAFSYYHAADGDEILIRPDGYLG
ncbi:FAD-dependent monooxygenase [Kribbella sp. CA-293567]|uniref:FAD-dependent monooxygenase n=1 Tax=Kribbella sp. CA-293567 TaxID=3002436 RepID=UPI0022DDF92D|nr:FAD-dependent monooxygenase [Kribbella sp. CA-293567]WBQ07125.1 FAD-dependent monooxygenase [Kribbella sp. CA-293567]